MKILLLGGYGMAGHMTASYLRTRPGCELTVTVRPETIANRTLKALEGLQVRELDVRSFEAVQELVHKIGPVVIVNAVGILNHHAEDRPLDAF